MCPAAPMPRRRAREERGKAQLKRKPEKSLAEHVERAMEAYFKDLDGHETRDLYALFMRQVETPFFKIVMRHAGGNITRAAKMLGLNPRTLYSRLEKYGVEPKKYKKSGK